MDPGGPTLLPGHSYGGAVITGAGRATNVVGLVYLAAFAPEQGESLNSILASSDPRLAWRTSALPSTTTYCGAARTRFTTPSARTSTTPSRWSWQQLRGRSHVVASAMLEAHPPAAVDAMPDSE
jgi:pimeloyl-ACP methyl ester carboxylesterase